MVTVIFILMLLVCFNFLLKQTFVSLRVLSVTTVLLALFASLMWPFAIEQSKTQISDWLQNAELMRDMAVILSMDVVIQLTFCIFAVRMPVSGKARLRSRIIYMLLAVYPGLIILPVIFATLVELIFVLPGVSFTLVSYSLGAAILLVVPLGCLFLHALLPEPDLRLEVLFLFNVLVAFIGVVATVNGNTQSKPTDSVDLMALAGFLVLLVTGIFSGSVWNKWKRRTQLNHQ